MSGLKRDEIVGGWRKMHNEELHIFLFSSNISRIIKPKRMRWAAYEARRTGMHTGFW
jgi:hypothetical protein